MKMSFKRALKNMISFFNNEKIVDCDECMSELEIARLIEDKVNKRERQRFFNHLSQCPNCYHLWSETAIFINVIEPERGIEKQQSKTTKQPFFDFDLFSPKIGIPALGAIATVCLAVILWSGSRSFQHEIDTAYQQLAQQDQPQIEELAKELAEYAQPSAMGFSKPEVQSYQKAFAAGLWEGRNKMAPEVGEPLPINLIPPTDISWLDSEWQPYYELGKWSALAWVASQVPDVKVDWVSLQQALTDVGKELAKKNSENKAIAEINRLKSYLAKMEQKNAQNSKALAQALTKTISELTPD